MFDYSKLIDRLHEKILDSKISYKQLADEMNEAGLKMDNKRLSRFFSTKDRKWMPERSLHWLTDRFKLKVEIKVKGR